MKVVAVYPEEERLGMDKAYRVFMDNGEVWLFRPDHEIDHRWKSESPLEGRVARHPMRKA